MPTYPRHPFGVSENRPITSRGEREKRLFGAWRENVVWWFDQNIARIAEAKSLPRLEILNNGGNQMDIGTDHQTDRNAGVIESALELHGGCPYRRARVVVNTRKDVRGTRDDGCAL